MSDDIYYKENKRSLSDEIKAQVEEFRKRGGTVQEIPYGVSVESEETFKNRVRMGVVKR
jgi:hypothetical protein